MLQEVCQLLDSLYGIGLVELRVGRVEVESVSGIKPCQLGEFPFRIAGIISLEIEVGVGVVLLLS